MKNSNRYLSIIAFVLATAPLGAQNISDFLNAGLDDANKLGKAYFQPYGEMLGVNLNTGWYNSADVHKIGGFDLTMSLTYAFAPSSMKTYDVNSLGLTNFQVAPGSTSLGPTLVGKETNRATIEPKVLGGEYAAFQVPNGSGSGGFPSPMLQGAVGLPFHTEVMARYMPKVNLEDFGKVTMWGIGVKHSVKEYVPFLRHVPIWNFSVMGAYTNFGSTASASYGGNTGTFEINSDAYTARLLIGANFPMICFYSGIGYGTSSSNFDLLGTFDNIPGTSGATVNPVSLAYSTSGFDCNVGTRLRLGFISFHVDYTVGKYNTITTGVGLNFR